MKNSWNHLHPAFNMVIFYLFRSCPATSGQQFSEENSLNQLNNWRTKMHPCTYNMYNVWHFISSTTLYEFVSDLRQVVGFLWVLRFLPSIKTNHHDITELLLKVALNTIKQTNISNTAGNVKLWITRVENPCDLNSLSFQKHFHFKTVPHNMILFLYLFFLLALQNKTRWQWS
jgi:hypothetical protein